MDEPKILPDEHGQCPPGYMWSSRLQQCVPVEPAPTIRPVTDISQKTEKPRIMPDAQGNCPEGYEWSAVMGQCVLIGTARSPADFKVYLHFKRTHTETKYEALKSVTILGLVIDRRCEQLGMSTSFEDVFKHKRTVGGKTVTVIVDMGEKLLEDAAKVAADLSTKYPQFGSSTEWKHRAAMFQHLPVKYLQDYREDMQSIIEGLKRAESWAELPRAYDYLKENLPDKTLHNIDEASKHWLDAMLLLRTADFSFYAAREASDHVAFTIDKTHSYGHYNFEEQCVNLPSTWDDPTVKAWREAEQATTKEREAMDAKVEENSRQREALKPMLTKLIEQGMTDTQIQTTLEAQKKPRQLIRGLMLDVRLQRLGGIQKHKPPKIEVIMSPAKERQLTQDDMKRLLDQFDKDVTALFPAGLTDQEIYDRVIQRLGDFDKDGTEGPIYQVFTLNDSDLLRGRIRNLRQTYNKTQQPEPTQPEKPQPEPWNKPTVISKDQIDSANKPSY